MNLCLRCILEPWRSPCELFTLPNAKLRYRMCYLLQVCKSKDLPTKNKGRAKNTSHGVLVSMLAHMLFEGGCCLLQKLSGRSVNPGLQMFGQSISGNVDMDGNGYTGEVIPDCVCACV